MEKYVIAYRRHGEGEGEGGFGEHGFRLAVIGSLTAIRSVLVASTHVVRVIVERVFCFDEEMAES